MQPSWARERIVFCGVDDQGEVAMLTAAKGVGFTHDIGVDFPVESF